MINIIFFFLLFLLICSISYIAYIHSTKKPDNKKIISKKVDDKNTPNVFNLPIYNNTNLVPIKQITTILNTPTSTTSSKPEPTYDPKTMSDFQRMQNSYNLNKGGLGSTKTVTNPDGSITKIKPNGTQVTVKPDGSKQVLYKDGSTKTVNADGSALIINKDGSNTRISKDKTAVTVNADGSTKTVLPNGETKIVNKLFNSYILIYF